jgi:hypothetical protein
LEADGNGEALFVGSEETEDAVEGFWKEGEDAMDQIAFRSSFASLPVNGTTLPYEVAHIHEMHIDLVEAPLEEVRISLSSDVHWVDRKSSIELAPLHYKRPPLAEILSFLDLLNRRQKLSGPIDVILEGGDETVNIFFTVMLFLDAVGLEQGLSLNLNLTEGAVLAFDVAKGVVISGIPICEFPKEILRTGVLEALLVDLSEVDIHGGKLGIGGSQQVNLFGLVELYLADHLPYPSEGNGHYLAQYLLLLLRQQGEIDLVFMHGPVGVTALHYQHALQLR